MNVFLLVLALCAGLLVGLLIGSRNRISRWREMLQMVEWDGEWHYALSHPNGVEWVVDVVYLHTSFDRLVLNGVAADWPYDWKCSLHWQGPYLAGEWQSVNKPSLKEVVQLQVQPGNQAFKGYCMVPLESGELHQATLLIAAQDEVLGQLQRANYEKSQQLLRKTHESLADPRPRKDTI